MVDNSVDGEICNTFSFDLDGDTSYRLASLSKPEFEFKDLYVTGLEGRIKKLSQGMIIPLDLCNLSIEFKDLTAAKDLSSKSTVDNERHSIITGEPGSGKSVYLQQRVINLAKKWLDRGIQVPLDLQPVQIPLYAKLSNYEGGPLEDFLLSQMGHNEFDPFKREMLRNGMFEIYLDGFDEVSTQERRDDLMKDILFPGYIIKNKIIITTRPNTPLEVKGFRNFGIEPLNTYQIERFLRYTLSGKDYDYTELHNKVREDDKVLDFCRNPLILSFIIRSFQMKTKDSAEFKISNKSNIYDQLVEGMFLVRERYRRVEDPLATFSSEHNVLYEIAYLMQTDEEVINPNDPSNRLPVIKSKLRANLGINEERLDELLDSIKETNLFYFDDGGRCEFFHTTIQEYFCAKWFRNAISESKLSIKEAYQQHWSYEESKKEWGVSGRMLLPAWKHTLVLLMDMFNTENNHNFIGELSRTYFETSKYFKEGCFNPFLEDLVFIDSILDAKPELKNNGLENEIYSIVERSNRKRGIFRRQQRIDNNLNELGDHFETHVMAINRLIELYYAPILSTAIEYLFNCQDKLHLIADTAATETIIEMLGDKGYKHRAEAAYVLYTIMGKDAKPYILNYVNEMTSSPDEQPPVISPRLAGALIEVGGKECIDPIVKRLRDLNNTDIYDMKWGLHKGNDNQEIMEALVYRALSVLPSGKVRDSHAMMALQHFSQKEARQTLTYLAKEGEYFAVESLDPNNPDELEIIKSKMGESEAMARAGIIALKRGRFEVLAGFLSDPKYQFRDEIPGYLSLIHEPQLEDALLSYITSEDKITGHRVGLLKNVATEKSLPFLTSVAKRASGYAMCQALLEVLPVIGNEKVVDLIEKEFIKKSRCNPQMVGRALAELPSRRTLHLIQSIGEDNLMYSVFRKVQPQGYVALKQNGR